MNIRYFSLRRCAAGLIAAGLLSTAFAAEPERTTAPVMLDSLDRVMLDSALVLLNIKPSELGFEKMWVEDDTFRLAVVERFLDAPLAFPAYVDRTTAAIDSLARRPVDLTAFVADQLRVDPDAKRFVSPEPVGVEFDPADPFAAWTAALEAAEPFLRGFYADLDSLELDDLLMAAPGLWSEGPDSVKKPLTGAWHREFGVRMAEKPGRVRPDTVFEACSMSKTPFAYAVLKLVEEGTLDLDKPLVDYLGKPYIPDEPLHMKITARKAMNAPPVPWRWRGARGGQPRGKDGARRDRT